MRFGALGKPGWFNAQWFKALGAALLVTAALSLSSCALITDLVAEQMFLPKGERPAEYGVRTRRDDGFVTSDGVRLEADIHAPTGVEKTPTILVRIPFNDSLWNRLRSDSIGRFWAKRGYTVVVQGTRGRYRSEGDFYPAVNEAADGEETLAWIRRQPWYDGWIGMWGGSAFGHTQWAVSGLGEDGPDAFAIQIASTSYFDTFHPGGALAFESVLYWALNSPPEADRKTNAKELAHGADGWPVVDADERAWRDVPFFNDWALKGAEEDIWLQIDGELRAERLKAPVLMLAGWYDPFLPTMLDDFQAIRYRSAGAAARQSRLVIGPYGHAADIDWPGEQTAERYRVASVSGVVEWFDDVRAGRLSDGSTAPIRLFVMGGNGWRSENEWPLARTDWTPYYFHADGMLSTERPKEAGASQSYVYDPEIPAETHGGAMLGPRAGVMLQQDAGARADVLSFVSVPLEEDLEVIGPLNASLYVSTDAPSTDFTIKLIDVHPDGRGFNIADGIVRRDYVPGGTTRIEVSLGATGMVFGKGHRIRVDISSSNYPRFDRNPNTGEHPALATVFRKARQTLFLSADRPSHIILPVIPHTQPTHAFGD